MTDAALLAALDRCIEGIEPITCRLVDPVNRLAQVVQRVREVQDRVRQGDPGMNCCEPKPCPTTLDFVGVALAILQAKGEHCDLPADVRVARATCVLSELATLLEQGPR